MLSTKRNGACSGGADASHSEGSSGRSSIEILTDSEGFCEQRNRLHGFCESKCRSTYLRGDVEEIAKL